jgi:GAF domain-containing protein
MPPGVGIAGAVLLARRPVRLDRYGDLERPTIPELGEHSVIGVPIWWGERMIGFFGIGAPPPRRLGDADIETLALFARHAAIAIENARRYENERRRTEQLALIARIGRIIASNLRLGELLQSAADAIHELLGYPNVAIPLIEPDDPRTMVLRTFGGHYRSIMAGEYRLSIDKGIMGAAVRQRRAELVNDVDADPRHYPTPGALVDLSRAIELGERAVGLLWRGLVYLALGDVERGREDLVAFALNRQDGAGAALDAIDHELAGIAFERASLPATYLTQHAVMGQCAVMAVVA